MKENKIFKKNTLKPSLFSRQTLTTEMQKFCLRYFGIVSWRKRQRNNYPCKGPQARARWEKYQIFFESIKENSHQQAYEKVKYQWLDYHGYI